MNTEEIKDTKDEAESAAMKAEEAMVNRMNEIPYATQLFHCRMHPDCHASRKGQCIALTGWDFSIKDCPFYKNREVNKEQQKRALYDLMERRPDLIEKYATVLGSLGILDDEATETDEFADELNEFEKELRGEAGA